MKRTWPIIGVANVQVSSEWYRTLLNTANNHPGDSTFAQVLDEDGTILLCLHHWGDHGHPSLMSPHNGIPGNGLLLFFCVSDFDATLKMPALLPRNSTKNLDSIRILGQWSSRFETRMAIMSRLVHLTRPNQTMQPTAGRF